MSTSKSTMMSFWKKKSKKLVVHLVFWPIIIVFVIFGFERFGNPAGGSAAVVNGKAITVAEYRGALQRMIDFYSQMTGGQFDEDAIKRYRIRETALQQLVSQELVAQEAEKMGVKVTDQELRDMIMAMPYFKKDGKFSAEAYEAILKNNRISPHQFEQGLKKEALVDKARQVFDKNISLSPLEKAKQELLMSQKINLEFIKVNPSKLSEKITVSATDVEKVKSQKDFSLKVKEYYDLNASQFNIAEQVKAKHILVKAQKGNAAEEKKALDKIKTIQAEIAKKSFSDLAKKYSDDPGSKANGGELGWFEKGRMVPEFESAAFSLKPGQVSNIVQTQFGFHIIKVEDKKAAKSVTLEQAKSEIEKKLAAQAKFETVIKEIELLMSQKPEEALSKLKMLDSSLKWQETGLFSIAEDIVPMVGGGDDVMKEALSLNASKIYSHKLLPVQDGFVVLKFKKSEKLAQDKNPLPASSKNREIFSTWAGKLNEKAKVDINPQLFNGGISQEPM